MTKKDMKVFVFGLPIVLVLAGVVAREKALLGAAILVALLFFAVPKSRTVVYAAWMKLLSPVHWAVSYLVLGAVFFLVVTPLGLLLRLLGRSPLKLETGSRPDTYWIPRLRERDKQDYFRQY